MANITVQHTNPGAVSDKLMHISQTRSSRQEQQVLERGFDNIYDVVYKRIRVKTGYARSTIRRDVKEGTGSITVGAFYAIFLEKGTSHSHAYPFFWANVKAGIPAITQELRNLYIMK
jgi:HK97 gp10 family phage protein